MKHAHLCLALAAAAVTGAALATPAHVTKDRHVVWSDEFDGTALDTKRWRFRSTMDSTDCVYTNDARTARVEDGCLHLQVVGSGDPEKPRMLSRGVATHDTMGFRYGYLEMRAQVPFRHGAWPSFWMQATPAFKKAGWMSEVDIFEVFSSTNSLAANIHKWGRTKDKGSRHVQLPGLWTNVNRCFTFPDAATLNGSWHVYGFEWTPEAMSFYIDDMKYATFPITEKDDFSPKVLPGMAGFHDFHSVIFNNEIFTPGHGWCPEGLGITPEDRLPIDYRIDWVRLWQRAGEAIAYPGTKPVPPYGVCAHVTRSERDAHRLKLTMDCMDLAGMKYVRSDFDAHAMLRKDGTFDFSNYDRLVADLEARGLTLLPILYGRHGSKPPVTAEELDSYRCYIQTIVRHYGRRLPVVEIWNEANLNGFFNGGDPVRYAEVLKTAYRAVKDVDPAIQVTFTGTAGVPLEWIRTVFEHGAANSFDIMNVHPYSHPGQPEGRMDTQVEALRALMTEFGCGDRPIWFSEIGWPTQSPSMSFPHVLLAGLKVARPERKTWKMVLADLQADGPEPDQTLAEQLRDFLPAGSEVRACTQAETVRRLAAGGVDAVVYPFDETFPADTVDAVNAFVKAGGVLIDFGGLPCYFGRRGAFAVPGMQHGGAAGRFPFGYRAWWTKGGVYPEEAQVFATARGLAAGVRQEPTGFRAIRFLAPDRIGEASEWIPLVAGKTTNGVDLVGAAVVRYHGERTGAAILCSLFTRGATGTNNEENQARFTARGLAVAFAEGVQAYFTYNLRSFENDPYYSEHHFGLVHADFTPKPAFSAYGAFTRERPAGSRQTSGAWHDAERRFFFPQWTRPDGVKAGVVWSLEKGPPRRLVFTGGKPEFRNHYGRRIAVRELGEGVCSVPVSDAPIYYSGAALATGGGR